jgi:hypothetical protein
MKVMIEYDTDTKELVVKEDGAVMPAVSSCSFYKRYCDDNSENKFTMDICQEGKYEGGVTKRVYTIAKMLGYED